MEIGNKKNESPDVLKRGLVSHGNVDATEKVFVCITGQVKRLVGTAIRDKILHPLRDQGYKVDVALVLSEDKLYSSNVNTSTWQWSQFESYQEAVDFFRSDGFKVVTSKPFVQRENPPVPPNYLSKMDKKWNSEEWQSRRVQNHARQFDALAECKNAMLDAALVGTRDEGVKATSIYNMSIRFREDVSLESPLNMSDIFPLLYPNKQRRTNQGTILGTDCRTFRGMNDRMAIVTPEAFLDYFTGPWKYFSEHDSDLNSSLIPHIDNTETFYNYVYEHKLKHKVVKTPKLRGVLKYVVRNEGSKRHPNITVEPAPSEIRRTLCPGDGTK